MSSTNKTPNYALPQFIPTDKPTWLGDVNAAMLAIDTAMADNHTTAESANTSASAAVAQVQHAVDTANEAKVDSAAALQNATNAIGVAQNALNSATQASQTAQAATQTANAANNSAASAVATANQAKQTAEATDAKLTEFEHAFSQVIPSQDGYGGLLIINPAYQYLHVNSAFTLTAGEEKIVWEFNGAIIGSGSIEEEYQTESNVVIVAHALENGKQKLGIKCLTGTASIQSSYAVSVITNYNFYLRVIANNPPIGPQGASVGNNCFVICNSSNMIVVAP